VRRPLATVRSAVAFVPSGWWRRAPFLPLPDGGWIRFRMETAYGDPTARPTKGDLGAFLAWTVAMRRLRGAMPPRVTRGR
jgi:hypothetical protein